MHPAGDVATEPLLQPESSKARADGKRSRIEATSQPQGCQRVSAEPSGMAGNSAFPENERLPIGGDYQGGGKQPSREAPVTLTTTCSPKRPAISSRPRSFTASRWPYGIAKRASARCASRTSFLISSSESLRFFARRKNPARSTLTPASRSLRSIEAVWALPAAPNRQPVSRFARCRQRQARSPRCSDRRE